MFSKKVSMVKIMVSILVNSIMVGTMVGKMVHDGRWETNRQSWMDNE